MRACWGSTPGWAQPDPAPRGNGVARSSSPRNHSRWGQRRDAFQVCACPLGGFVGTGFSRRAAKHAEGVGISGGSPWARRLGVKEESVFGEAHAKTRRREDAKKAGARERLVFASSFVSCGKSLRVSLAAFSSPGPWLMALEGRDSGMRACNPSGVGMRDLAYPGCASRPRAIGFNASGVVPIRRGMKLRPVWARCHGVEVPLGSAPLHPGFWPCAALRRGRARDACPGGCVPNGTTADFRCQNPAVTTLNQDVTDFLSPVVGLKT
jgi:hypothetical protein